MQFYSNWQFSLGESGRWKGKYTNIQLLIVFIMTLQTKEYLVHDLFMNHYHDWMFVQ